MENTSNEYEAMSSPTPEDDIYEAVNPKQEPVEDQQGYLVPYLDGCERRHGSSKRTNKQTGFYQIVYVPDVYIPADLIETIAPLHTTEYKLCKIFLVSLDM